MSWFPVPSAGGLPVTGGVYPGGTFDLEVQTMGLTATDELDASAGTALFLSAQTSVNISAVTSVFVNAADVFLNAVDSVNIAAPLGLLIDNAGEGIYLTNTPLVLAGYTTAGRPPAASWPQAIIYDTTLNTVVYSNGAAWVAV